MKIRYAEEHEEYNLERKCYKDVFLDTQIL